MSSLDTLSMALKNLYKRKFRTLLTVLGVVVGACAIIIMISLGIAINTGFEQRMMTTPNATRLTIYNYEAYYGYNRNAAILDDEMFERIMRIPNVEAATPWVNLYSMKSSIGRYIANIDIIGLYPEAMPYMGYTLARGTFLDSDDPWGVVYGAGVPNNYKTPRERMDWRFRYPYDTESTPRVDVLKDRIKLSVDYNYGEESYSGDTEGYEEIYNEETTQKSVKPHDIHGVGVLEVGSDWEASYSIFMDIKTVQSLQIEKQKWESSIYGSRPNTQTTFGYYYGYVKVANVKSLDSVIEALLDLGFAKDNIYDPASNVKDLKETMSSLQVLLGAMGAISLFIAAIGISNTMIMSTVERTREIGVMKVIGASLRDIRKLFLLESAIIGLFGGTLGVGISHIVSYVLNQNGLSFFKFIDTYNYYGEMQTNTVSIIPFWLSLASLGIAAIIGLVAGFFPAQRATRLSALAAIRSD